ncbi:diguanylate cyclase [Halobacillus yeomjeoni]|uniref:Diguanylate cyclase n=1 Tax=Halobacillus yeomjeoni TaxID=311194 RepID=A0A931HSQ5_9BACI|nr:diguanylate cyclase [Halobacillus yeomjeoni]MBH0228909.1 diguanylate cyclase [Halobacillus yeomjeoni]
MVQEMFFNLTIMVSFMFIMIQTFHSTKLKNKPPIYCKVYLGAVSGILSVILIHFSIYVGEDGMFDLRHIPLMISAIYGGWVSTLITGICSIAARFSYGMDTPSMMNFLGVIAFSMVYLTLSTRKWNVYKKTTAMLLTTNIIFTLSTNKIISSQSIHLELNTYYWMVTFIGGFVAVSIFESIKKKEKAFAVFQTQAFKDPLTGLNNVRGFQHEVECVEKNGLGRKPFFSLLMIDIDHFKKVNDTYGHQTGDELLIQLSKLLLKNCHPNAIISRNGGEEFTVVVANLTHDSVSKMAEKLRREVEAHLFYTKEQEKIHCTISIGVATYKNSQKNVMTLYQMADGALYEAKKAGRNQVVFSKTSPKKETYSSQQIS